MCFGEVHAIYAKRSNRVRPLIGNVSIYTRNQPHAASLIKNCLSPDQWRSSYDLSNAKLLAEIELYIEKSRRLIEESSEKGFFNMITYDWRNKSDQISRLYLILLNNSLYIFLSLCYLVDKSKWYTNTELNRYNTEVKIVTTSQLQQL